MLLRQSRVSGNLLFCKCPESSFRYAGQRIFLHQTHALNLTQIWRDYLDHLAFAIRNLNLVIDSPVIISGYLAPYFQEADMQYLLSKINESSLFQMDESQLLVGNHGQYTPAIGAALYYIKEFLTPAVS